MPAHTTATAPFNYYTVESYATTNQPTIDRFLTIEGEWVKPLLMQWYNLRQTEINSGSISTETQHLFVELLSSIQNLMPKYEFTNQCLLGISVEDELYIKREDERGYHYITVDDDGTISYCRVGKSPGEYSLIPSDGISSKIDIIRMFCGSINA